MAKLKNLEELVNHVQDNGGVTTISVGDLRDMYGADRLGIHVRSAISKEIAGLGLTHYPSELPDRQHEGVRVYKQGSPVAEIIDAVLRVDAKADAKLRKVARGDSEKTISKIRELLDEES